MSTLNFIDLTWEDVEKMDRSKTILVLPVGSVEQHGPHLPLDTDTVICLHLLERLIQIHKRFDLIMLPPLRYTYAKPSTVFPGTISIGGETLIRLTYDILSSFISQKFEQILIVNSHYENTEFLIEGVTLCLGNSHSTRIIVANWWELIDDNDMRSIFGQDWTGGWVDEHAALVETSLMMSIAPELVRQERIVDDKPKNPFKFRIFPWDIRNYPASGVFSKTSGATRERGERLIESVLNELNKLIEIQFTGAEATDNSNSKISTGTAGTENGS